MNDVYFVGCVENFLSNIHGTSSINLGCNVHGFISHKIGSYTIKCVTNATGNVDVCVIVFCGSILTNPVKI
jgi:hypothetical protein